MKAGDLYYIPQDVILMQFDDEHTSPKAFYKTDKPLNVVVVERERSEKKHMMEKLVKVFCNGQKWYVDQKDLFEVRG